MRSELKQALDNFINVYKYTGIHASKPNEQDAMVKLKDDLFEGIVTLSLNIASEQCKDINDAKLLFVALGVSMSKECAKYFNEAKIPYYQPFEIAPSGPPVELDDRFFLIALTQLSPEQLRPFLPILEDFFILDRIEHPDYIGPDLDTLLRHIKKNPEEVSDEDVASMTPMEDIANNQIVSEYFKTFRTLKTYIGEGKYENENARKLYDRMNTLQDRLLSL